MPSMIKVSILFSLLFFISEMILALIKHSVRKSAARRKDRGSLIFLWATICGGLTFGFFNAGYGRWNISDYIIASTGLLVIVAGFVIRWTAILQLKKAFTVDVAINNAHELKTDGLYSILRHPSYLGLLMIMIGIAVSMDSLISFVVVSLPVSIAILYRIQVEEHLLQEAFGDMYRIYRQNTKKIIPFIY
ncbi:MAG: isoprenylcysteine carboxylmethyltransferase family protein [Bacteroidales bacterium]